MTAEVQQIQTALVLAAGKSTRLRSVSGGRPKPLVEVAGQTVLERNLQQLARDGVTNVWINLHYLGEQVEQHVGTGQRFGLNVRYAHEPELLGTAGAAKNLEAHLSGSPFYVVYGDNLTALDLRALTAQHRATGALATIAVFDRDRVPNTGLAGGRLLLDEDRRVLNFEEGGSSSSPYVNAGVYVLDPAVLSAIRPAAFQDFGQDVFPHLLEAGAAIYAFAIDGYCLGIDTPEAFTLAEEMLKRLDQRDAH
jgi:NDP-sugar pyrophosphorylase family protein